MLTHLQTLIADRKTILDYYNYSKNSSKIKFKDLHDAVQNTKEEIKSLSPILKLVYLYIKILTCL